MGISNKLLFLLFNVFWTAVLVMSAPVPKKIVDMTHTFDENSQKYPIFPDFNITFLEKQNENGSFLWNTEEFHSPTHLGTHMDAPSDFALGGKNIDQLELKTFIAPAAVIDIREKAQQDPDAFATVEDFQRWEDISGRSLDGTMVLVNTGWAKWYNNRTAFFGTDENNQLHFPGVDPEAARWLVDHRSIVGVGTDCMSLDRGISADFASHVILLGKGLIGLENVANIDLIPVSGAMLYSFPIHMRHASGSPTRVVAVFADIVY